MWVENQREKDLLVDENGVVLEWQGWEDDVWVLDGMLVRMMNQRKRTRLKRMGSEQRHQSRDG